MTRKILGRAEGVPLYAVETVRMLLDRGLLVENGPIYTVAGSIEDLEVPETLHALIAARLDGLTPEERKLVQDASVIGKTFTRAAALALSGLPERDLEPLLASLVAKEVLSIQADPRSPEQGQYGFLQDLVRTVAYETLSKQDRKAKHLHVAAYLEGAWGEDEEEIVEVVASHLLEAYRLAPDTPDGPQVRERARRMLMRAAERSASLAAAAEAQTYFQQAAELADSPLERAELAERAGQMAGLRGRLEEAAERYERAISLFLGADLTHAAARVQARLAEIEWARGNLGQATERMQEAFAALSGEEPDADLAMVAAQLGRFLVLGGRGQEAVEHLELALELAQTLELPGVFAEALNNKAGHAAFRGRLEEATLLYRHALDVALERGLVSPALRAYNNLATALEWLDRYDEERELWASALEFARRAGDRFWELTFLTASIFPLMRLGRWDEAIDAAEAARNSEELSSFHIASRQLVFVVPILVNRGETEEARRTIEANPAGSEAPEYQASFAMALATLLLGEGDPAGALNASKQGTDLVPQVGLTNAYAKEALVKGIEATLALGDLEGSGELLAVIERARPGQITPYLRAQAARLVARLASLRGEDDVVEPGFLAAERGFREIDTPFDLGVALLEHAEWLVGRGRELEADPLLDEARDIFNGLRAIPWLERLSVVPAHERHPIPAGEI